jgi:photosystem II CP43 chlorophyll apoprotein
MKVCVPGWHRLTSRMKTSSSLKRFCPAVTLSNFLEVITALKASPRGGFFMAIVDL